MKTNGDLAVPNLAKPRKLRVLDLFSGIGGFSLGLERTGGFETIAFCEIEPYCQKVLKKHWPDVPIYNDVRHIKFDASANILYDDRYGHQKTRLSSGNPHVSDGPIYCGSGEILREDSSSDVAMDESQRMRDASKSALREGQPLPSGREDRKRQSAEHSGNGYSERNNQTQSEVRNMRGKADVQGRKNWNSSPPLRLQQAIGSDVVVPTMSSRMAQEEPGNTGKEVKNGIHGTIDVVCGGFP